MERVSGPAITSVSASNVVFALCPELGESIAVRPGDPCVISMRRLAYPASSKSEMGLQKSSSLESEFVDLSIFVSPQLMPARAALELKSELHGKEETFGRLRSREKQLKKYITYFNASEGALQGVITHVAALSNFWESVSCVRPCSVPSFPMK